jgi:hypothetical protein
MTTIQEILDTYGPAYIDKYQDNIPKEHIKVIHALTSCRTAAAGIVVHDCASCGLPHVQYLSCGNRHCNVCQGHKAHQWLDTQSDRQLPGHHFMITFTIPELLRPVFRSHQRIAYEAMFAASSQTLKAFAADPKFVGGDLPGFFGVLHTWGRQLHYHPHIHYVVTGGAVSTSDGSWHPSRLDFFAPVKAMSKVFRGKLKDLLKEQGIDHLIDPAVWQQGFNVNSQHVASSYHSIRYLAPYVFKVAIGNHRIIRVQNDTVLFRYKKSGSSRWRTMSLSAMEFIRRFLQHVLPAGFMKVRYYGFMGSKPKVSRDQVRTLIEMTFEFETEKPVSNSAHRTPLVCPECGGRLVIRWIMSNLFGPVKGAG